MTRRTEPLKVATVVCLLAATALAACGGDSAAREAGFRDGVYEFELTERYLRQNGFSAEHARKEAAAHEITLDRGSFVDRWRAQDGTVGCCAGVVSLEGTRATFRWTDGCTGDWAMSFAVDGDRVTWSDVEPLDPSAGPGEQQVIEVFNGVPWTRTGDVPEEGER